MATTALRTTRPSGPPKDWREHIRTKGNGLPSRLIIHGVEGVGKTSFAACSPKPIFLMSRGETGLETLIDASRLGDIPHLPELVTWSDALSAIDWLTTAEHDYKTLALDTLNGLEKMCHEHVCDRDYGGDWSGKGFASYMQGYDVAQADWRELLSALDRLREAKRMATVCLCHSKITEFKNPLGANYDRYVPALHEKTWQLTHRWADHVLFANFYVEVTGVPRSQGDGPKKGKGMGGDARVMYTVRNAAYDAKNRAGLPEEIEMGNSGREAWDNFIAAVKSGRQVQS